MELNEDVKKLIAEVYKTKCEIQNEPYAKYPYIKCLGEEEVDACLKCLYAAGYVWGGSMNQTYVPTPREKVDGKDVILIELHVKYDGGFKDDLCILYSNRYRLHADESIISWPDLFKLAIEEE